MLKNASRSNNIQKTILLFLFFLLLVFIAHAQYSLGSSTYVQDFNDLPNSGTQLSVTGDDLNNVNVSLNGWCFSETGSNANTSIRIGSGSSSTGDTYSFGVGDESDRTLGCLQSSSLAPTFGFYFKNNTNAVITSITICYSGETWRIGTAGRSDKLDFQYSLDASSLINGTWTDFDALDYENTSSTVSGGGSLLQSSSVANTLTGISITNGSTFFIRWKDFDATGSDDGVGIDDITISVRFSGSYSNATDYFRSNTLSGNWGTPDSWQSSADGSTNWITATVFPTTSAAAITISNGTTITINSNATAKALTIETGGTLKNFSGDTLTIADDAGIDFTVYGTYVLYGTEPIFASGATAVINSGGLVRADGNTGGKSDAFASDASVLFKTGSIFEWAIISGVPMCLIPVTLLILMLPEMPQKARFLKLM